MAQRSGYWRGVARRALPAAAVGLVVFVVARLLEQEAVPYALAAATATLAIAALLTPRRPDPAHPVDGPGPTRD